jgi:hypothetical protein
VMDTALNSRCLDSPGGGFAANLNLTGG